MIASGYGALVPLVALVMAGLFVIAYAWGTIRNGGTKSRMDVESIISNAVEALKSQLDVTEKQRDSFRIELDAANVEIGRLRGHLENVQAEFDKLRAVVGGHTVPEALKQYLGEFRAEVSQSNKALNERMDALEALLRESLGER